MDDTNSTDDYKRRLIARIDSGQVQCVEGIANLGRHLGMSRAKTKQALEAVLEGRIAAGEINGQWVTACRINRRWLALVSQGEPRQEESPPPAADKGNSDADGSQNSTPMRGSTIDTDTDNRTRRDAAVQVTAMLDRVRAGRLTRHDWRVSRRGNSYIDDFQGCHVVVWRVLGGWRFHVVHKATGVTWQSDTVLAAKDEAKVAALDKLSKRLPEFLRRLAAERSSG